MVLMASTLADPTVDSSTYFFGYIGVASALVFASNLLIINEKIWALLMGLLSQALGFVRWVF
jgi:hypothetical protein